MQQSNTAACDHTFLNGCTGSVHGVFDTSLLFLHGNLGSSTDLDDGYAAGKLGNTLLKLLTIVVGGGFLNLLTDLSHTISNCTLVTGTLNDGGVILGDHDLLSLTEIIDGSLIKLHAEL